MTTPTSSRLAWGILATGRIAAAFARGVAGSQTGRLAAAGSRTLESAQRFAAEHRIPRAHGSYEALLEDPEVQAVYIATPHPQHVVWTIRAAEAGKHILCEKPIGINEVETQRMLDAAHGAKVTLMEAWMYRCHPQTRRLVELVQQGAIGRLRHVQASFSFHEPYNPESRTWNHALGGGGILDVGGYPLSCARLLAGVAHNLPFLDPEALMAFGDLHPETGIDVHTTAIARFAGGITAELFTGVGVHQEQVVRVYGTEGWIRVASPFVIAPEPEPTSLYLYRGSDPQPEAIVTVPDRGLYAYEADAFGDAVRAGQQEVPACTWADTLGNMRWLDAWRGQIGLAYAADQAVASSAG